MDTDRVIVTVAAWSCEWSNENRSRMFPTVSEGSAIFLRRPRMTLAEVGSQRTNWAAKPWYSDGRRQRKNPVIKMV